MRIGRWIVLPAVVAAGLLLPLTGSAYAGGTGVGNPGTTKVSQVQGSLAGSVTGLPR